MSFRKPCPRLWLMTDERCAEPVEAIVARLPRGAGVVFRHYRTLPAERRALFVRLRRIARARRLTLVLAGSPRAAAGWRADGVHGPDARRRIARPLLRTMAAHDAREVVAARSADLVFVSPVFATRSHPGAPTLNRRGFAALARGMRAIALGGMDARRARALAGAYGWAGIDAWETGAGTIRSGKSSPDTPPGYRGARR